MENLGSEKGAKTSKNEHSIFYCDYCHYTCCKKWQIQKYTCKCGKQYKNNSGLWKHHKKCSIIINDNNTINELNESDDINDDDSNQDKNTASENPQMEMLINLFQERKRKINYMFEIF